MQAKLSASTIKNLQPENQPYEVVDTEIKGFLLRVQPSGRMTFYFSYRSQAGKRKRFKIGQLSPSLTIAQARDKATIFAGKVSEGVDIQGEKLAGRQQAKELLKNTLSSFIEDHYQPWASVNLKSGESTVKTVKSAFSDYLDRPMSEIQLKQVEQWRTQRLNAGNKPATINRIVNSLRGILTKALAWEAITEHPLARLKNLKLDEGKKARFLSPDEETRLNLALADRDEDLKAARARGNAHKEKRGKPLLPDLYQYEYADRMTPLVTLALKTGMRRGELFDLEWSDVDLDNKVITIDGENAKSSKTRHIPLSPTAFRAIKAWKKQAPLQVGRVFPSDEGIRLDNVNKSWASILDKASIENFRWHDMRHDFASKLVMNGVPLNTVRELCGHADLNTTLRYAHLAPDHKAEAIASIG